MPLLTFLQNMEVRTYQNFKLENEPHFHKSPPY